MENKKIKIAVAGTGYVGLSIATLLSQHHEVVAVDVVPEKVELINSRRSPIQDEYIEKYLAEKELNLKATTDGEEAYKDANFVVIATPTNYDPVKNYFDTSHVEEVIRLESLTKLRRFFDTTKFWSKDYVVLELKRMRSFFSYLYLVLICGTLVVYKRI